MSSTSVVKRGAWRSLWRLAGDQGRKHWAGYALGFLSMTIFGATTAYTAYLMKDVVDGIFVSKNYDSLYWLTGVIIATFAAKGAALYLQTVVLARVGNSIVADIQRRLYQHMLTHDLSFYQDQHSTQFIAQISFISNAARDAMNTAVSGIGRDLLTLIALMSVVIAQDPFMALAAIVVMPVSALAVARLMQMAKKVILNEFTSFAKVLQFIQETAQGIRVVKTYLMEESLKARMDTYIRQYERANNKLTAISASTNPLMEILGGLAVGLVLMYGGYRVIMEGQTPGQFFSFLTAFLMAYEPAKRLARLNVDIRSQLIGVEMLYDVLDKPGQERDAEKGAVLTVTAGDVAMRGVRFAYRPGQDVIRGLDFTAQGGKTTALVGKSGGGKTTILALLQRLYTPHAGTVMIDGQDLQSVSLHSLRGAISYVSQDVWLFSGSIRENIAIGRPDAEEAEIVAAAKAAGAHGFILGMGQGYDTLIGERGVNLSGGQRQRLAIARAILKNAPILLLDEATAALDAETERDVQLSLERLRKDRTTIVIAHRLQTVMSADKICVIEQGRMVEEGRHDELLRKRGRYAELYTTQFRDEPLTSVQA